MAKVLITLLGILLLLNTLTFLLVAFQEPGGGEATAEGDATDPAITALSKQVDGIARKVTELTQLRTSLSRLPRQLDSLTRKTDSLARKLDGVALAARPSQRPAEMEEEEPVEEEPLESSEETAPAEEGREQN